MVVDALAVGLMRPPRPSIANRLTVNLREDHVLIRVAIDQMRVGVRDLLHRIRPLDLIGHFACFDDGDHFGVVRVAPKTPEGEAVEWRRGLNLNNVSNRCILPEVVEVRWFNAASFKMVPRATRGEGEGLAVSWSPRSITRARASAPARTSEARAGSGRCSTDSAGLRPRRSRPASRRGAGPRAATGHRCGAWTRPARSPRPRARRARRRRGAGARVPAARRSATTSGRRNASTPGRPDVPAEHGE